jgi:hypothetical protein
VANEIRCDLIVLGTHGRTGLGRLLLGNVAEHVLRRAKCPVLTVRHFPPVGDSALWQRGRFTESSWDAGADVSYKRKVRHGS